METNSMNCPICNSAYTQVFQKIGRNLSYKCSTCGSFVLTDTVAAILKDRLTSVPDGSLKLSYSVRRVQGAKVPILDSNTLDAILTNTKLPSLQEQNDNLILHLSSITSPGLYTEQGEVLRLSSVVGARNFAGVEFVIDHCAAIGLLEKTRSTNLTDLLLRLTMKGWERADLIQKGKIDSRKAFMAMPFGDRRLDRIYQYFKSAVDATAFDLRRLDETERAGLIDDRLRMEIRTSRFLVCELTNDNRGAYWEAGYAEGLGKPVIYTCEKKYFEDRQAGGTHFDTNHHLTVLWEDDNIDKAVQQLKAVIRTTLPDEAMLED